MHANRYFTHHADGIPQDAAAMFPSLIAMSSEGDYTLAPALLVAIAEAKKDLDNEREETKRLRDAKAANKKRKRPKNTAGAGPSS